MSDKEIVGLVDPGSPSSEPFRSLRLALQLGTEPGGSGSVILFTSSEPGEGKSTVAANYALVSSLSQGVLLIDGDLRQPSLHDLFGIPRSPGVGEVISLGADFQDVVQTAALPGRLDVVTAGRPIPRSGDVAASERMGELLRRASDRYALVVVDSPPILRAADAIGLASHPDVEVVLVVKRSRRRSAVKKALAKLELVEANVAGIVLNREGNLESYAY